MILDRNDLAERGSTLFYGREETVQVDPPMPGFHYPDELLTKLDKFTIPYPFVAEFEDVRLLGPGGVGFTPENDIILETAFAGRLDVMDRNRPYLSWAQQSESAEPMKVELGVSMMGTWTGYYFHWLLEQLPKLEGIDKWVGENNTWPTLILQPNPPKFVIETVEMLGYQYVHSNMHVQVERLLVPSHRRHQGRTPPSVVSWLRANINKLLIHPGRTEFLIDRSGASERRLLGGSEILEQYPFMASIRMESYPVGEQASLWGRGTRIIAPHGGGLANMVFGDDLAIFEIFGSYVNPCFFLLAAACGHKYVPYQAEAVGSDMRVDVGDLVQHIQRAQEAFSQASSAAQEGS